MTESVLKAAIDWLFVRGHAADLLIAVMAAEAIWLHIHVGWSSSTIFYRLLPGACLAMALRAALTDAQWPWIAFWLSASLPPHLADLRRR